MSPERPDPDSRLEELSARLARVEERLAALEGARPAYEPAYDAQAEISSAPAASGAAEAATHPSVWREAVPLTGRTLLVIAGAFLLRVITEAGWLPQRAGAAVGIAYAIVWLVVADRSANAGKRHSATFHGLSAALIAFPLLWEVTVRFKFLTPTVGAVALLGVTAVGLVVASRQSLRRVAWVVTVGAIGTALGLAVATKMLVLFVGLLLLLGLATLWLGYAHGWRGPGRFVAATLDFSILLLTLMPLAGDLDQVMRIVHPGSLVYLQLALVLVYCGTFGVRTLIHREEVGIPEIVQGAAALFIGLGGAVAVERVTGYGGLLLGVVSILAAAGCYGASFVFIDQREGGRRNFIFFTTLALVFTMVALEALIRGAFLGVALAIAAVVTAWLGKVRSRATLSLHGAVYAVAAMIASGLLALGIDALVGPSAPGPGTISVPPIVALVVAAACCGLPVALHGRTWGKFSRAPKFLVLLVLTVGVVGMIVMLVAPVAAGAGEEVDPGALAVVRTAALALSALALGWLGKSTRLVEAAWLVYPLLVAGGAKLLLEDLPNGRPSTLFMSLAFFGGALILAHRFRRGGHSELSSNT